MKRWMTLAVATVLCSPALAADTVLTKTKHFEPVSFGAQEQPARDTTEVTWIGKEKMRVDEGDRRTLIRLDLKKAYVIDDKAKTISTLDLPLDIKKYVPPEMAPMMETILAQMKVTVTPTTETKKIKEWNATKYTMTLSLQMGGITQEMWITKDITLDRSAWNEMSAAMTSMQMGGEAIAGEMKKLEGIPIVIERTQKVGAMDVKSRDELVSVEQKEAPADWYELPKDYAEKPFDPMSQARGGAPRAGKPAGKTPEKPAPPDRPAPK